LERNLLANTGGLRIPQEISREASAALRRRMSKTKALKRLFAGFIEQLMGNILIKEPMARCFPKIVGFQTTIRDGFNIFERFAKSCGLII
jgi:hypothetical protein